jgi:hypothetical protein
MPHSIGNDELVRLSKRMQELKAQAEVIEHRIGELKSLERGVIDDTALLVLDLESDGTAAKESLHTTSV